MVSNPFGYANHPIKSLKMRALFRKIYIFLIYFVTIIKSLYIRKFLPNIFMYPTHFFV
jgi:hypothetical protein